jgi:ribosomal small subunit protein bTHX
MGRGDKRSAKGKRTVGSYGNSRPQRVKVKAVAAKPKVEKVEKAVKAPKKVAETVAAEKPKKAPAKKKKAEGSEE